MGSALHREFTLKNMITHAVLDAQMNLTLTQNNECPRLYNTLISFWRHASILPQRNHLLHDLITRVFIQSLQYGIAVLGFLDAFVFVYAFISIAKIPRYVIFGDCMKGKIRCMTAITLAYSPKRIRQRVLFNTYLASRTKNSGFPSSKPDIRMFPMFVP